MNVVSPEMKDYLLKLKKDDLTISFLTKLIGHTTTKSDDGKFVINPPMVQQNARMHLNAGEYINTTAVDTNVGIFLFNKIMIENRLEKIIPNGYYNEVITKKSFNKIMDWCSSALRKGDIHIDPELLGFLQDFEFYGLKAVAIVSPSFSTNLIHPIDELRDEKDAMLKKDTPKTIQDMVQMEDKLVSKAAKKLDNDEAMSIFKSGSRGTFDNDYKNMALTIGPVENPTTGEYDFVPSNYIDGLQKKDLVAAGNIVVTSEYPKAVGTRVGGYLTKQFYAVYQSIVLGEPGSDCGTNQCLDVFLNESNIDAFLYQYIKHPDGKLEVLNEGNSSKFLNKHVKMRSPMFCLSDKICNKCAGERFSKMDIQNIGLTSGKISNTLMNLSLKKRHNMKLNLDDSDPETLLL